MGRIHEKRQIYESMGIPRLLSPCSLMGNQTDLAMHPQLVLSKARALDRISYSETRPLHGVAVAIKDVIDTKGVL